MENYILKQIIEKNQRNEAHFCLSSYVLEEISKVSKMLNVTHSEALELILKEVFKEIKQPSYQNRLVIPKDDPILVPSKITLKSNDKILPTQLPKLAPIQPKDNHDILTIKELDEEYQKRSKDNVCRRTSQYYSSLAKNILRANLSKDVAIQNASRYNNFDFIHLPSKKTNSCHIFTANAEYGTRTIYAQFTIPEYHLNFDESFCFVTSCNWLNIVLFMNEEQLKALLYKHNFPCINRSYRIKLVALAPLFEKVSSTYFLTNDEQFVDLKDYTMGSLNKNLVF